MRRNSLGVTKSVYSKISTNGTLDTNIDAMAFIHCESTNLLRFDFVKGFFIQIRALSLVMSLNDVNTIDAAVAK